MRSWIHVAVLALTLPAAARADTNDWSMLGHDPARTGATAVELRPPFERNWYRLFTDEGLMSGVQPVVSEDKVFVGTLRGVLHAIDKESGKDVWTYRAAGAILHTVAVDQGRVFFGSADGTVTALDAVKGKLVWEVPTGSAVWNAPAVFDGIVFIGSRDQQLYAIEAATGTVKWTAGTEGPLLGSPAIDPKLQRVYIGCEDMRVYAFGVKDGVQAWHSGKLPGVSLRGYHPVIAPDGAVLVTAAPGISVDTFQALLLEMVKTVFGDFASWRHSKEANETLREENFALLQKPETFAAEMEYIRKRLNEQPVYQTFFVLDPSDGKQKFVAPIVYSESMNGPGAPAIVSPEGKVIVKFQALLRSRYEHYSPFLNVGELDTATGKITPIMDQSRTYGWYESLLLVHDEQSQLSLSGRVLINTHQDNVNGLDLQNLEGFAGPFCRNIHEPKPGEAIAIWARLLRDQALSPGKEWLARGTAVYGGGSVLDTPVSIAGDSFYYLPTHEINAGVAVIAYRANPAAGTNQETALEPETLTPEEWKQVQDLPWDWDTLEHRRLRHVLEALPAKVPGTRQLPLTNEAAIAVAAINDSDLDAILWQARAQINPGAVKVYTGGLKADLAKGVKELISKAWQPLVFPSGKFPEESYRFFSEPTETLSTLACAYPHLDGKLQEQVRAYVTALGAAGGPLDGPTGQRTYLNGNGEVRSTFDPPPEKLLKFQSDILRTDIARLYPLWSWAYASGDWSKVEHEWPNLVALLERNPNNIDEDCRNGYTAGLIAYCRLAERMKDTNALTAGVSAARRAMRQRLEFELAYTRGGLISQVPKMRAVFSRWRFLTPEVARLLDAHAHSIETGLMARYVDYHRPTWWLAWNVETMMRNECPYEFPSMSAEVFAARSLILHEPAEKLALWIDRPWCRADEYYIQKLALTLDAAMEWKWIDLRQRADDAQG